MTVQKGCPTLIFKDFLIWLKRNCKTPYRTANLGHQGNGITATYEKNCLQLSFGNNGKRGSLKDVEIEIIFNHYLSLRKKRLNAGQYSGAKFTSAPDMIKTPFVPALFRDFEFELYVDGKI